MLTAPRAVESVVGRHDAERSALAHGELERYEVDLAQGAWVDDRARHIPFVLRVVRGKVFDRGSDSLLLRTPYEGCRDTAGEQWIFGIALEVAPRERRAVRIDRGSEQHAAAFRSSLATDQRANFFDQLRIPCCAQ